MRNNPVVICLRLAEDGNYNTSRSEGFMPTLSASLKPEGSRPPDRLFSPPAVGEQREEDQRHPIHSSFHGRDQKDTEGLCLEQGQERRLQDKDKDQDGQITTTSITETASNILSPEKKNVVRTNSVEEYTDDNSVEEESKGSTKGNCCYQKLLNLQLKVKLDDYEQALILKPSEYFDSSVLVEELKYCDDNSGKVPVSMLRQFTVTYLSNNGVPMTGQAYSGVLDTIGTYDIYNQHLFKKLGYLRVLRSSLGYLSNEHDSEPNKTAAGCAEEESIEGNSNSVITANRGIDKKNMNISKIVISRMAVHSQQELKTKKEFKRALTEFVLSGYYEDTILILLDELDKLPETSRGKDLVNKESTASFIIDVFTSMIEKWSLLDAILRFTSLDGNPIETDAMFSCDCHITSSSDHKKDIIDLDVPTMDTRKRIEIIWSEVAQKLVSLPDKLSNILKGNVPRLLRLESFFHHLSYCCVLACLTVSEGIKVGVSSDLTPVAILLSKACRRVTNPNQVLEPLLKWLPMFCSNNDHIDTPSNSNVHGLETLLRDQALMRVNHKLFEKLLKDVDGKDRILRSIVNYSATAKRTLTSTRNGVKDKVTTLSSSNFDSPLVMLLGRLVLDDQQLRHLLCHSMLVGDTIGCDDTSCTTIINYLVSIDESDFSLMFTICETLLDMFSNPSYLTHTPHSNQVNITRALIVTMSHLTSLQQADKKTNDSGQNNTNSSKRKKSKSNEKSTSYETKAKDMQSKTNYFNNRISALMSKLLPGIANHLDSPDIDVKKLGMTVGMVSTKLLTPDGPHLEFEFEDTHVTKALKDTIECIKQQYHEEELRVKDRAEKFEQQQQQNQFDKTEQEFNSEQLVQEKRSSVYEQFLEELFLRGYIDSKYTATCDRKSKETSIPIPEEACDSCEGCESVLDSDDSDEGEMNKKLEDDGFLAYDTSHDTPSRRVVIPSYPQQLVEYLVGDNVEKVEAALEVCKEVCVRDLPVQDPELSVELCDILLNLDDQFNLEYFEKNRQESLTAVTCSHPRQCALYLCDQFYATNYNMRQRHDALLTIKQSVLQLSGKERQADLFEHYSIFNLMDVESVKDLRQYAKMKRNVIGRGKAPKNEMTKLVGYFFYSLIDKIHQTEPHLDLINRDTAMLCDLLHTLGVILHVTGDTASSRKLLTTYLEQTNFLQLYQTDPHVQLSYVKSLGLVLNSVSSVSSILSMEQLNGVAEYLSLVAKDANITRNAKQNCSTECKMIAASILINLSEDIQGKLDKPTQCESTGLTSLKDLTISNVIKFT